MANPSKAKGTRAESRVVKYLRGLGYGVRRKALAGSKDEGDIEFYDAPRLFEPLTIEVKAGKQTANPSRGQLEEWLRQSWEEAQNCEQVCAILIVVRYNRKLEDADVWCQAYDGDGNWITDHMWFDEWAKQYS